ncbi:hypothetical protein FCV25MIE_30972 [Fagus crenata]
MSPMRPYLAVSLLLLSLLLSEVQGIRLDKTFMSVGQQKVHEEGSALTKNTESVHQEVILCKDGKCSGKNRKLITTTISTTSTTSKNEKNEGNKDDPTKSKGKSGNGELGEEESFKVKGRPTSEISHDQEHFPDIIDLAEMDYSPAKRKPPIHN